MDNSTYEQAELPNLDPAVDSRRVLEFHDAMVEETKPNENPASKKHKLRYSYTKDDLIRISKTPLANKRPACLDKLYYNSYGVWEPERWFNETRCETPHSEDGKGKRERSVDNDRDLQPKRRQADTKDIVREEQDGIVLGPQRRSFGTGCHVAHAVANRGQESPTDARERERESTRRIGSGRIINREREREYGYRGGRDRFERDRDDREKEGPYSRGDRYGRERIDDRRPMRNDNHKGKRPFSVSEKAGSVETTESSSADNSQQSDTGMPPTNNRELDLNDFFTKMDGFPNLVEPNVIFQNGTPPEAGIELAGSRFSQWFRNTSSPTIGLGPGFDSRRSSFQEELLGPIRKDMDDPFPEFPSPTCNLFTPISPELRRPGDDSGGNIMELLQQAASRASMDSIAGDAGSDIINNVRNVTMKELAMSGKAKSVQELEEGLKQLVMNKSRSNNISPVVMNGAVTQSNNDLSAFNKLLAQVSEGEVVPAQMGGGFSNTKVLQEKDILKEIVSRISPPPEVLQQDPLAGFLNDNFPKESQPVIANQQHDELINMLQNNTQTAQHTGWGNRNEEQMLQNSSQHTGWGNHQEPMRLSCWGSDNEETLRASGWGADPSHGLMPSIIGQPKTVSPNLNQPVAVIDHFHNIQQQPFRDKVLSQLNQLQQGLPHMVNSFPQTQQLIGSGYIPTHQPQTIISGFIPVSQHPMMGRNGPVSSHPVSPIMMDPIQQTLQTRIPSPLLFSQTPPMLSHAPSPIHPNQLQNVVNLQPSPMIGRVPSPLELAVHAQQSSQNAIIKRKLEEQRENARKRIELRPKSPGFSGGNRPPCNINNTSPKPALSSTMANLMPTSVMRKLQADSRDGMKNDIPQMSASAHMSAAAKNNAANVEKASMQGSQLVNFCDAAGVPASTAGSTFPVRSHQVKNIYSMGRPIVKGNQAGVDAIGYFQSQGMTSSGGLNTNSVTYGSGGGADLNGGPMLGNQVRPEYLGLQHGSNVTNVDIARALEQQRLIHAVQRQINANQANLQMHPPPPMAMNPNTLLLRNMVHPAAAINQLAQIQQASSRVGLDPRFAAAVAAHGRGMLPPMNLQHTMMGPPPSHPQHPPPTSRAPPISLAGLGIGSSSAPATSFPNSDMHVYQQHSYNMMNKVNYGNANNPMNYMGLNVKPNTSEQVSPNNMLAKFFGNDVLNQSMPNLPSVPTQALSLEEVERRQQITVVHN